MLRRALTMGGIMVFTTAALGAVALGALVVLGMRTKSQPLLDTIRRLNRDVLNPAQLRSAGAPGAPASVIHHTGRSSGRCYETPVGAVPTEDGFVIALPYGLATDWVRNVLASEHAAVQDEGVTYEVDRPEVVSMDEVAEAFPRAERWSHRLFAVEQCLRLRRVETVLT